MNRQATPVIVLAGVGFGYRAIPVFSDVTIDIHAGDLAVVTGANGSGKSTLLQLLFGLLQPTAGRIAIDGGRATVTPETLMRWGASYVPQGHRVFRVLTAREHLELVSHTTGVAEPILAAAVEELFPELKAKWDIPSGALSGGERAMLLLGMALGRRPRLLLLDEPSTGLASEIQQRALGAITASCSAGAAVVIAEHDTAVLALPNVRKLRLLAGALTEQPKETLHECSCR